MEGSRGEGTFGGHIEPDAYGYVAFGFGSAGLNGLAGFVIISARACALQKNDKRCAIGMIEVFIFWVVEV